MEEAFGQSPPPSPLGLHDSLIGGQLIEEYPALVVERLLLLLCRFEPLTSYHYPEPNTHSSPDVGLRLDPHAARTILHLDCELSRYPTCRTITMQVAAGILLDLVRVSPGVKCEYPLLHPKHWNLAQKAYSLARYKSSMLCVVSLAFTVLQELPQE